MSISKEPLGCTRSGKPDRMYVKQIEIASALEGEEVPEGASELFAWNVTHSDLVSFVQGLDPEKLYKSAFVAFDKGVGNV